MLCQHVRQSPVKNPVTLRGQRFVVRQVNKLSPVTSQVMIALMKRTRRNEEDTGALFIFCFPLDAGLRRTIERCNCV